jgi:hypothetical protein
MKRNPRYAETNSVAEKKMPRSSSEPPYDRTLAKSSTNFITRYSLAGDKPAREQAKDMRSRLRILLLQNSMVFLFFTLGVKTCMGKAAAHLHIRLRLRHQCITNVLLAPPHPTLKALVTQRIHRHIHPVPEELGRLGHGVAHDIINITLKLLAVGFKRQIVYVHTEGILDFAADSGDAEDNVGSEDASRNCHPSEVFPELEGQHHYVDPGYLRDGDGVGDWKWGLEDAFYADEHFIQLDDRGD